MASVISKLFGGKKANDNKANDNKGTAKATSALLVATESADNGLAGRKLSKTPASSSVAIPGSTASIVKTKKEKQSFLDRASVAIGSTLIDLPPMVNRVMHGPFAKDLDDNAFERLQCEYKLEQISPHHYTEAQKARTQQLNKQLKAVKQKKDQLTSNAKEHAVARLGEFRRFVKAASAICRTDIDRNPIYHIPESDEAHRAELKLQEVKSTHSDFALKDISFGISDIRRVVTTEGDTLEIDLSHFSADAEIPGKNSVSSVAIEGIKLALKGPLAQEIVQLLGKENSTNAKLITNFVSSNLIKLFGQIAKGDLTGIENVCIKEIEDVQISTSMPENNNLNMLDVFRSIPMLSGLFSLADSSLRCQRLGVDLCRDGEGSVPPAIKAEFHNFSAHVLKTDVSLYKLKSGETSIAGCEFACDRVDILVDNDSMLKQLMDGGFNGLGLKVLEKVEGISKSLPGKNEDGFYPVVLRDIKGKVSCHVKATECPVASVGEVLLKEPQNCRLSFRPTLLPLEKQIKHHFVC